MPYLSEKELAVIYQLNLSDDKELDAIRDIFIVGCFIGLRYNDLSTLSPEHVDVANGNISLKQRKVHKAVVIPMIDYVPEILEKYNYDLPKIPSYTFNERVKELGKITKLKQKIEVVRKKGTLRVKEVREKWEMISSHTCRRSFCTNMYLSAKLQKDDNQWVLTVPIKAIEISRTLPAKSDNEYVISPETLLSSK